MRSGAAWGTAPIDRALTAAPSATSTGLGLRLRLHHGRPRVHDAGQGGRQPRLAGRRDPVRSTVIPAAEQPEAEPNDRVGMGPGGRRRGYGTRHRWPGRWPGRRRRGGWSATRSRRSRTRSPAVTSVAWLALLHRSMVRCSSPVPPMVRCSPAPPGSGHRPGDRLHYRAAWSGLRPQKTDLGS
jgi:hypothetical protein